eukprot:122679_1
MSHGIVIHARAPSYSRSVASAGSLGSFDALSPLSSITTFNPTHDTAIKFKDLQHLLDPVLRKKRNKLLEHKSTASTKPVRKPKAKSKTNIKECSSDHGVRCGSRFSTIMDTLNDPKLHGKKEKIMEWIQMNETRIPQLDRKAFINEIYTHCDDRKIRGVLGKIYKQYSNYKPTMGSNDGDNDIPNVLDDNDEIEDLDDQTDSIIRSFSEHELCELQNCLKDDTENVKVKRSMDRIENKEQLVKANPIKSIRHKLQSKVLDEDDAEEQPYRIRLEDNASMSGSKPSESSKVSDIHMRPYTPSGYTMSFYGVPPSYSVEPQDSLDAPSPLSLTGDRANSLSHFPSMASYNATRADAAIKSKEKNKDKQLRPESTEAVVQFHSTGRKNKAKSKKKINHTSIPKCPETRTVDIPPTKSCLEHQTRNGSQAQHEKEQTNDEMEDHDVDNDPQDDVKTNQDAVSQVNPNKSVQNTLFQLVRYRIKDRPLMCSDSEDESADMEQWMARCPTKKDQNCTTAPTQQNQDNNDQSNNNDNNQSNHNEPNNGDNFGSGAGSGSNGSNQDDDDDDDKESKKNSQTKPEYRTKDDEDETDRFILFLNDIKSMNDTELGEALSSFSNASIDYNYKYRYIGRL